MLSTELPEWIKPSGYRLCFLPLNVVVVFVHVPPCCPYGLASGFQAALDTLNILSKHDISCMKTSTLDGSLKCTPVVDNFTSWNLLSCVMWIQARVVHYGERYGTLYSHNMLGIVIVGATAWCTHSLVYSTHASLEWWRYVHLNYTLSSVTIVVCIVTSHTFSQAYVCQECQQPFCIDCDLYCHETLYSCPGCESQLRPSDNWILWQWRRLPPPPPPLNLEIWHWDCVSLCINSCVNVSSVQQWPCVAVLGVSTSESMWFLWVLLTLDIAQPAGVWMHVQSWGGVSWNALN